MNYVVLDMEWNQPYRGSFVKNRTGLTGEIVQIGAVKLDENFEICDNSFKILIAPKFYKQMHRKVAKLTKISDDDLRCGFPFKKAVDIFKEWCGDNFAILTWGADDIPILLENISIHRLSSEWLPKCFDLQKIYDKQIGKERHQWSLIKALERVGEIHEEAHDALNDAIGAARVCRHLDMEKGIEEYDSYAAIQFGNPAIDCDSSVYSSKKEAISGDMATIVCGSCGKVVKCVNWVSKNKARMFARAKCSCGKEYIVRVKFKRAELGVYAIRTIYPMYDDIKESYKRIFAESEDDCALPAHESPIRVGETDEVRPNAVIPARCRKRQKKYGH